MGYRLCSQKVLVAAVACALGLAAGGCAGEGGESGGSGDGYVEGRRFGA